LENILPSILTGSSPKNRYTLKGTHSLIIKEIQIKTTTTSHYRSMYSTNCGMKIFGGEGWGNAFVLHI
jgi:hypothetical protein